MSTFLVTGATGRQGGPTARLLLAKGAKVHALVRDPDSPASQALRSLCATLFKGDFDDTAAITAAMKGVNGVFLNPYPSFTDPNYEIATAQKFVDIARTAGTVTSFVVSTSVVVSTFEVNYSSDASSVQADYPFVSAYYASKAGIENAVRASGFTYTILRPGWLMHNYIGEQTKFSWPGYNETRVLTTSYPPDFRLGHLDPADVGQFAAAALLDPARFAGKEIQLVHDWVTVGELAAHLSEAIGVEVKVKYRTEEESAAMRKQLPTVEVQLWKPTVKNLDDSAELASYRFHLTTLKEFLEKEKVAVKKTVGIEA
ncbi:NAD dependent epimerase/dehydratase [Mycena metata]|uniref:NAD dependent epimerase/dehydratase n=1 Tax=Mycena metata TaxID=1033252 RepID=A0AAD7N0K6_9AGAR|nr:NAD dependent epimerase/dehydratase [Mycena metata]